MDSVSQNDRRLRRPWTAQDQVTLEVAAACGLSFAKIGAVLRRTPGVLHRKIGRGMELRAKDLKTAIGRRSWTPQDQVNLEVAAACGVPLNRLAALWNRSESHLQAKISHTCREARKQSCRDWRANNKDRYLAYARQHSSKWRKTNFEKYKLAEKSYYIKNKQRHRRLNKQWRDANRDQYRALQRRHQARRRQRKNPLLPCDAATAAFFIESWGHRCSYCGDKGRMTIDHVLPIAYGGLDEIGNLLPACAQCNSSKNASPVESWYRRQPFFTEARWRKIQRYCPAAVAGQLPLALPA
jgi:5-methylcytosine-specific restriction endonuclease McrA